MAKFHLSLDLNWSWKYYLKLGLLGLALYGAYYYGYNKAYEVCVRWVAENCGEAVKS